MTTIVTRTETQTDGTAPKGSELTWSEVDTNFINLNDNKVEVSGAIIFAAKAGEALSKGDVVYVSGVSGNEPVVSKADADDASKMPAFGLAEADANLNAAVNVVTFGTLYDIDTSAFSAGDTVYVSTTPGSLTSTKPAGESSLLQNLGLVIRSHASAGSIKVGGAGRTNAVPNLNDGNVFIGNASNQAASRALTAADIQSGTFADARIAQSSVTQHQAALSITESQISDLQSYLTAESDTLDSVTGRGATTTNSVTIGGLHVDATTAVEMPTGTDAQRPTPVAGMLRFNTTSTSFEGYDGSAWGAIGGGGGATEGVFYENDQTLSTDVTIAGTKNAMATGPVAIASGVSFTVSDGARVVIL